MKLKENVPPRVFDVGHGKTIKINDCASIELEPDEQVTFRLKSGAEYDVTRKSWGFYATPSLNGRLKKNNLSGVLVKGPNGKYFVWLVEKGQESGFEEYLYEERHQIVRWLVDDAELAAMGAREKGFECVCGAGHFHKVHTFESPPPREVGFAFSKTSQYCRELYRCRICGHFISVHEMEADNLYSGDYVSSNYKDEEGLKKTYDRIVGLPPSKSDNQGRVNRVLEYSAYNYPDSLSSRSILDIGSGLCVFLHEMKNVGWKCTALDPDLRAVSHAEKVVGVKAVYGDFMKIESLEKYDVITFNKVLEHVQNPVDMLSKAKEYLKQGGFVYVELPDAEAAWSDGPEREEFTIDHPHVFTAASAALLAQRAGYRVAAMECVKEPSSKYTIRAFLKVRN